jgi:uncharacterized Ntn-hydrolase superfamily protein
MTLSITGRCERTGQLGFAACSYDVSFHPPYDNDLRLVPGAVAVSAIGAAVSQAQTPPGFSMTVVNALREGAAPQQALDSALHGAPVGSQDRSQVAVLDAKGFAAAFTGERIREWKGHWTGEGWAVAGNTLAGEHVLDTMVSAFQDRPDLPLDERLLEALGAGVSSGGDSRGHRGAWLRVATGDPTSELSIQIHEHVDPVGEVQRLLPAYREHSRSFGLAVKGVAALRSSFSDAELQELSALSTAEAVARLRVGLAERTVSKESLELGNGLLSALTARPDIAETKFGEVLRFMAA